MDIQDYSFLENKPAEELLEWAFKTHGNRCAIGTSLQKTGVVTIDVTSRILKNFRVFFLDSLKFPDEAYDLLEEIKNHYSIQIERFAPDPRQVEKMHRTYGQHLYYTSFGREYCCKVRKVDPCDKALETLDVWISGIRASQSKHRKKTAGKIEIISRKKRKILKLNPLFDWSDEKLDAYIKEKKVPQNKLYNYCSSYGEKYNIIGCKCCHIPVLPDTDSRFGKFPWESGDSKECGLHVDLNVEGGGI